MSNEEKSAWRERILELANAAKSIAWHGAGGPMPPDHLFIRGAMALDAMNRAGSIPARPDRPCQGDKPLAVCLIVAQFFTAIDDDPPVRSELLRETLHDQLARYEHALERLADGAISPANTAHPLTAIGRVARRVRSGATIEQALLEVDS